MYFMLNYLNILMYYLLYFSYKVLYQIEYVLEGLKECVQDIKDQFGTIDQVTIRMGFSYIKKEF
jgi:hypothetical protein